MSKANIEFSPGLRTKPDPGQSRALLDLTEPRGSRVSKRDADMSYRRRFKAAHDEILILDPSNPF